MSITSRRLITQRCEMKSDVRRFSCRGRTNQLAGRIRSGGQADVIDAEMQRDPDALKPGHRFAKLIDMASEMASGETIERLLAHGHRCNPTPTRASFGTKGYTPLHSAAWHGNLEAIRVLVKHRAELDPRDATHNATPLGWPTTPDARSREVARVVRRAESGSLASSATDVI